MTTEKPSSRSEIINPTILVVNWYNSKSTVASFTRAAINYESTLNREFLLKVGGSNVEELLYNLGHNGRGLQDFPRRMSLIVPQSELKTIARESEKPILVATMLFPQLYDQLTDQVEEYIVEVVRKRETGIMPTSSHIFQKEIDAMRELAKHSKGKSITVSFTPIWNELHDIKKMEGEGYSYKDQF